MQKSRSRFSQFSILEVVLTTEVMMNDENRVASASGTGPSAGYTFVFLFSFTGFLVWLMSGTAIRVP
jgi:hypothetical protein